MVNKHYKLALLFMALFMISPTGAQASTQAKGHVTVSELDAIMQEDIVLKAKTSREKQRAELGQYSSQAQSASMANNTLPQVAWRRSTASGWLAKFVLESGASVIASTGEHLPGGYEVAQINDHGVKLRRDGELLELTAATIKEPSTAPSISQHPAPLQ